jgi:IPT/TIG domain
MIEFFLTLALLGLACVIAAIAGGTVRVANVLFLGKDISTRRQAILGAVGGILIVAAVLLLVLPGSHSSGQGEGPKVTQSVESNPGQANQIGKEVERRKKEEEAQERFEREPAKIRLSPTEGAPGTQLTITGTGFKPHESVEISFQAVSITEVYAYHDGSFKVTITVPATNPASPGPHVLEALGRTSNKSARWTFDVT